MYSIQLGSFLLNGQIILLFAFGLFGWAAMRGYLKKARAEGDFSTIAFNAFVIWFLLWKGSPLLLDPVQTIQQPLSLLYFDGGMAGRWIASIAVGWYVVYRVWKEKLSRKASVEAATIFLLGGSAAFHTGLIWFESDNGLFHAGYVVLALAILLSFFITKQSSILIRTLHSWQWFTIGLAFLWFLNPEREFLFLSFSTQQAISFAVGITLSVLLWFHQGRQTKDKRGNS